MIFEADAALPDAVSLRLHSIPALELYVQPRAGRFADSAHASDEATFRLDAARVRGWRLDGAGSARVLAAGHPVTVTQHPRHEGATLMPLAVEHVATNNLGSGITALLAQPDLEHGSYRNRFVATPADVPVSPLAADRPRVHGPQTARVVGLPEAAVTPNRDHQVRIQFAWQRGERSNPGGLSAGSHAPGDHTSGTWVPVAEWLAGPNWGTHFLPRIGAEVLVEFLHGDIDQPRITGQLYNGEVALPFAAGIDGGANHPGTLSGLHTQGHDGDGTQQWVIDDTPGQLRTRLHTTLADSRLELGYLIEHGDHHRGGLRGQGVELATAGWGNLHAAQGLLLSTTARPDGASPQMDIAEAVSQLKGAERTAEALHDTLSQQDVPGLDANGQLVSMREALDRDVDGAYRDNVAGQSSMKPAAGSREPGDDPVERFADARLIAESPESIVLVTPKSAIAYAGGAMHITVQDDAHIVAGSTTSWVSGQHTALYAHAGPIRVIAANGPVSVQSHTGELELLADQSVTLTATDDRIDVLAQQKIVLQAGQSRVVLEGCDITFECPGEFTVKASQHPFRGGQSADATLPVLPDQQYAFVSSLRFAVTGSDALAESMGWAGKTFRIIDGTGHAMESGTVPEDGRLPRVMHDGLGEALTLEVGASEWSTYEGHATPAPEDDDNPEAAPSELWPDAATDPGDATGENRYAAALSDPIDADALPSELVAELLGLDSSGDA